MKKIKISFIVLGLSFIFSSSGGSPAPPPIWEQENVSFPMMNQEIKNALEEGDRQTTLLANQTITAGEETVNEKGWDTFKKKTIKINDRLRNITKIIKDVPTGVEIVKSIKDTKAYQEEIIKEIKESPYLLAVGLPLQYQFADDAQMTLRFLAGIVLSYGTINQMEQAERNELLDYAKEEVFYLEESSYRTLKKIRAIKNVIERKRRTLSAWVNMDKRMVRETLKGIEGIIIKS